MLTANGSGLRGEHTGNPSPDSRPREGLVILDPTRSPATGAMSETTVSKPAFLGLLNAIAVGESRGGQLLSGWARTTSDPGVRAVLEFVAVREAEHGAAFTKRLCELGFAVREISSERFERDLACATSTATDLHKFEQILRYQEPREGDPLSTLFAEPTIDPETGALLGRFIAEERDSERRLRACYQSLRPSTSAPRAGEPLLRDLADRLDRLTATLAEIRELRSGG